ncbi:GV1 [Cochliomyia hominivorax]
MVSNLNYLLVTVTCFVSICTAIRVDWNTNTGPIIPPTPRTTVRPVPPFREPAPVWEDLSNDIPNPNPYVYVPPPPSRPKQRLNTNVNYNLSDNNKNYGTIITPYQQINNYNNNLPQVGSLATQYLPNVGNRYVAIIPPTTVATKSSSTINYKYPQPSATNALSPDDKNSYKLQGKYNLKTKKYKAYEKVKYVPLNYYSPLKSNNITSDRTKPISWFQQLNEQQLPAKTIKQQWSSPLVSASITSTTKATTTPTKFYSKYVYAKDTTIKPKQIFNVSELKTKKS